jgi:hypothetical protein
MGLTQGQEVTEFTETSELNLNPNEYNIIYGETIILSQNVVLEEGDQVELIATNEIILKPGFNAKQGSNFKAKVDTASSPYGMDKNFSSYGINIFPNPSSKVLNIRMNDKKSDYLELFFTDLNGKILYQSAIQSGATDIQVENYPDATYLLQIVNKKTKDAFVKKIVIKH